MPEIFIYQIRSYYTKPEDLDPSCGLLDNSANERPDWYEYWPIRKFLLGQPLQEDAFYGFLSPKFKEKTNLSVAAARAFAQREGGAADVILLSPSLHLTAYYWNVFHYGEACHPGLLEVATRFFSRIGKPTDLQELVTDSRIEVHSNYFLARPRFWRAWLDITEQLVAMAESPSDPLGVQLCKPTDYRGHQETQLKIFVLERIPTWLLSGDSRFTAVSRDPFVVRSRLYKVPGALVCDALKIAYATNHHAKYKDLFPIVSKLGRFFGLLVRGGNFLGVPRVRAYLATLAANWTKAGRA